MRSKPSTNPLSFEESYKKILSFAQYSPLIPPREDTSGLGHLPSAPFHERHLASELSLKRLVISPSLLQNIETVYERAISKFKDFRSRLPSTNADVNCPRISEKQPPDPDAFSVSRGYARLAGDTGQIMASVLSLHLEAPEWGSVLRWTNRCQPHEEINPVFNEDLCPIIQLEESFSLPGSTLQAIDPQLLTVLKRIDDQETEVAIIQAFSPTPAVEKLFKDIDSLSIHPAHNMPHPGDNPLGPIIQAPHDAKATPWDIPMAEFVAQTLEQMPGDVQGCNNTAKHNQNRRQTQESSHRAKLHKARQPQLPFLKRRRKELIYGVRKRKKTSSSSNPPATEIAELPLERSWMAGRGHSSVNPESLIRHAWFRAVEEDSTFIILHCGTFQRIGFRHRETGTLLLSELINPVSRHDPGYGALHIGLWISVLQDSISRFSDPRLKASQSLRSDKKGPRTCSSSGIARKPQTRAWTAKRAEQRRLFDVILAESRSRDLLLLRFAEGPLQSPVPSKFFRLSALPIGTKRKFQQTEYFAVTLTSRLAEGSTGIAHRALISLVTSEGDALECPTIVKLAYKEEQRGRLRHEFSIYSYLHSCGVEGIPQVFGIFQDLETRTMAILMQDVGDSIQSTLKDGKVGKNTFIQKERDMFIAILENIHLAGVLHRDIRPPNLTRDDTGMPYIIDFDRAVRRANERSYKWESLHFRELLSGSYAYPENNLSSASRPPSLPFTA